MPEGDAILLGAASLDIYKDSGVLLPGGGCLNMAFHWRQQAFPHLFLTRAGAADASIFLDFFHRHQIEFLPESLVADGRSCSIDVAILPEGQPFMDNFVEGVLADFQLTPDEEARVAGAELVHTVLVDSLVREMGRLAEAGVLKRPFVSADYLDFRHFNLPRLAETLAYVNLGFVGWSGAVNDPMLAEIRQTVFKMGRLMVVTLGSRGVLIWDGRTAPVEQLYPVDPVPVTGTTIGCGDAFIAYFLAEYWRSRDLVAAVAEGKRGGAMATEWHRPLPDAAYSKNVG